jgi:hypothetical protein
VTFEAAPDFRCPWGHHVGAQKKDGVWSPQQRCFVCESKAAQKAAAQRRKLGAVAAGVDIKKAFEAYRKLPPLLRSARRQLSERSPSGGRR